MLAKSHQGNLAGIVLGAPSRHPDMARRSTTALPAA